MKKFTALLLALAMMLSLVACSSNTSTNTGSEGNTTTGDTTNDTTGDTTGDTTTEDLHFVFVSPLLSHPIWLIAKEGFETACEELGVQGDWVGPQGLSSEEMAQLVEVIRQDRDVRFCPHGRPVSVTMTRSELERKFGRLV